MDKDSDILVLYDGLCNVCVNSVAFIQRRDSNHRFRYLSIQSEAGRQLYEQEGLDPDNIQTFVLIHQSQAYVKSEAAIRAVAALGGIWKCVHFFRLIPLSIRDTAYFYFAKNRYRLFGRHEG